MNVEELRDCADTLGCTKIMKICDDRLIGIMMAWICSDDEMSIELNQISLVSPEIPQQYWINCPPQFCRWYVEPGNRLPGYYFPLKHGIIFTRCDYPDNFILEYRNKDGKLQANKDYPYPLAYNENDVLSPDIHYYTILLYCDLLGNDFLRNVIIK